MVFHLSLSQVQWVMTKPQLLAQQFYAQTYYSPASSPALADEITLTIVAS